jgi:hypothetical protein
MRNHLIVLTVALSALVASSPVAFAQANQQSGAAKASTKVQPFDPHDMSGVWTIRQKNLTMSTDVPPMTPAGQAAFNANKPSYGPRAIPPALGNDPMGNCDPLGYPRTLFYGEPVQIVQTPGQVLQLWQYHSVWRTIWTDGRELPKDADPAWMGHSVGKWDGDTFVVETNSFDDRTWLDHFGYPHSDQMQLEERYHRVDHDTMEVTMTLTDPVMYTKPWASEMKTFTLASPKLELSEEYCVPSEEQAFNKRIRDRAGKGQTQ